MAALTALAPHSAAGRLHYHITGDDLYSIGRTPTTHITYAGTQSLEIEHVGGTVRFVVQARCTRTDAGGTSTEEARFIQELLPDGSSRDLVDDDPDFLTILNQPFAVRLDTATIRALHELHGSVPFAASSPLGGSDLAGELRPGISGMLLGHRVVGVRFQADGSVSEPLPERIATSIVGRVRLDGTAYYDAASAVLVALHARLTIDGTLEGNHLAAVPVRIVYRREIRSMPTA